MSLTMFFVFFFCKQKTAYEMRISDWSSDVCSSDLLRNHSSLLPARKPAGCEHPPASTAPALLAGWRRRAGDRCGAEAFRKQRLQLRGDQRLSKLCAVAIVGTCGLQHQRIRRCADP